MRIFTRVYCFLLSCLLGPLLSQAQSWQSAIALPAVGGSSRVSAIVADGTGGYVVAGEFSGTLTLGSFTLTNNNSDVFIARLNSARQWTQAVSTGGSGTKRVWGLSLDATGGVVAAGTFAGTSATFGNFTLANLSTQPLMDADIFVVRLNAAGQWTQAVRAGGAYDDKVSDVAVNLTTGVATVVGAFKSSCTFGTRTLTGSSLGEVYVARLTASGSWAQAVGVTSNGAPNFASNVALDAAGNSVISGYYFGGGAVQFGNTTLTSSSTAAFVARLNTAGIWTQAVQATTTGGFMAGGPVAVDANNNVVLTGNFRDGPANFGPYTLPYTPSGDNVFVARLSSAGVWTQAAQASDSGSSFPQGIALSPDGSVWVAGQFRSLTIRFGSTTLTNPSTTPLPPSTGLTTDIFVARLSATGNWTHAIQAGGLSDDFPSAILLDGSRMLVAGGFGPTAASFGPFTLTTSGNAAGFIAGIGGGILPTVAAASAPVLALSPNPATATTLLTLPASDSPRLVYVRDVLGRSVSSQLVAAHTTAMSLAIATLKPGLYLVSCGSQTQRLVVQ